MKVRCIAYIEFDDKKVKCSLMIASLFRVLYEAKGGWVHEDQIACAAFGEEKTYHGEGVCGDQIRVAVDRLRAKIAVVSAGHYITRGGDYYRMNVEGENEE